jgi:uncharacterized protein (DUF1697 family)
MRYVAFLRNLNQGQVGSPTSTALVSAFQSAGASEVATFQSNGTVSLSTNDPRALEHSVVRVLSEVSPWSDAVFVRSFEWVSMIVESLDRSNERFVELSVFDEAYSPSVPLDGRRCRVERGGAGFAVTINERVDESNATPTLERALGTPVTSRSLPTLRRLLGRDTGTRETNTLGDHAGQRNG